MKEFYAYIKEETDYEESVFSFKTNTGSVYSVSFDPHFYSDKINSFPILLENGVALVISIQHKGEYIGEDKLIGNTIVKIVYDYLKDCYNNIVLLYHCDYVDGRQKARNKKFEQWYKNSEIEKDFEHYPIEIEVDNISYFVGCFACKENPKKDDVYDEFISFAMEINSK